MYMIMMTKSVSHTIKHSFILNFPDEQDACSGGHSAYQKRPKSTVNEGAAYANAKEAYKAIYGSPKELCHSESDKVFIFMK